MKKEICILLIFLFSSPICALSGFDRMRCKNQLIGAGDSLEEIINLCGDPIGRRNWGNQYLTKQYLIFKEPHGGMKYYLYFENHRLVESLIEMHWERKNR